MGERKLSDEELADVAARILDGACPQCNGSGQYGLVLCEMCDATGNFALSTDTALNIIAELRELRELRALLATPSDREVSWHNNGRGPRIVFECGNEDFVLDDVRAIAFGAALIRTALEARAGHAAKGGAK